MINSTNTLFGYFDEEFTLRRIRTPTEKFKAINNLVKNGCVDLSSRKLNKIPFEFINFTADRITNLVLDRNHFKDLSFLVNFTNLVLLSVSKNKDLDLKTLPYLPRLKTLHLNESITDLYAWLQQIRRRCPQLEYLSLRGSYFEGNKVSVDDATNRRRTIIRMFPSLLVLDDMVVTRVERESAEAYLAIKKKKDRACSIL